MHTHTHTHVYERIDVLHTHMHIYTYIHVRTHTHIHIYAHTHKKCTYETYTSTPRMTAQKRTCKEPLQTKEALHYSFVRRNPTTFRTSNARTSLYPRPAALIPLHPLFPTYPRTVRSLRSFTMAPCVVVERLEGKQRCSRAAVSEHARIQARK